MIPNGVPLFDLTRRAALRAAKRAELGVAERTISSSSPSAGWCRRSVRSFFSRQAEQILRALPEATFLWVGDGALSGEWDARVAAKGLGQSDSPAAVARRCAVAAARGGCLSARRGVRGSAARDPRGDVRRAALRDHGESARRDAVPDCREFHRHRRGRCVDRAAARSRCGSVRSATAARQLAEERFSFGRMAAAYEALYRESARRTVVKVHFFTTAAGAAHRRTRCGDRWDARRAAAARRSRWAMSCRRKAAAASPIFTVSGSRATRRLARDCAGARHPVCRLTARHAGAVGVAA